MTKLIIGFVLGLIVATVGFSGVARLLDSGVEVIKQKSQEAITEKTQDLGK
jgi:hypothetical protein